MRRSGVLFTVAVLLLAAASAPRAWAHADLTYSEPAVGSVLADAPSAVRLGFNEEVSSAKVQLLDGGGRPVDGTRVSTEDAQTVVVSVPDLGRGSYDLVWDVLSADDGHVTDGTVSFGVRTPVQGTSGSRSAGDFGSPLEAALRWLDFILLAGVGGGIAVAAALLAAGSAGRLAPPVVVGGCRRVVGLAATCAGLALPLGCALFAWEVVDLRPLIAPHGSIGASAAALLSERWGVLWVARELLLAALAIVLWIAVRRPQALVARPRFVLCSASAALLAVAVARAAAGHAAAAPDDGLAIAADSLHQLGAVVWIGGLFAFVVAAAAVNGGVNGSVTSLVRGCWRPFAVIVGLASAVVAITGLYAAGVEVTSVDGLLTTTYGNTLIAKSGLVVLILAFAGANAIVLGAIRARGGGAGVLRLLLAEAALGAMVLVAAAIMTSSSPPRGPQFGPPTPAPSPTLARPVRDLILSAAVRPNRPGSNIITVAAASSRRPPPAPIGRVTALVRRANSAGGGRAIPLMRFAPGRFSGGLQLAGDGRWRLSIVVHRGGDRLASSFGWKVAPPDPARPVEVSAAPLAPALHRLALLAVTGLAAICLSVLISRRLRRHAEARAPETRAASERAAPSR